MADALVSAWLDRFMTSVTVSCSLMSVTRRIIVTSVDKFGVSSSQVGWNWECETFSSSQVGWNWDGEKFGDERWLDTVFLRQDVGDTER